jgi:multidrug efflux pump subunit AcrB
VSRTRPHVFHFQQGFIFSRESLKFEPYPATRVGVDNFSVHHYLPLVERYAQQQKGFRDMALVLVLAIILVFMVLLFEFRNFSAPVAILSSALLSIAGVFLALLVTGKTVNLASLMGMIMVIGIVAKNGILLLDANQKFAHAGFEPEEAMIQAGRRRLRPIFMTALATMAGMLPLAFALGAGSEMLQPLAIAVIGGILISMVLSLVVTPAVYFYLGKKKAVTV